MVVLSESSYPWWSFQTSWEAGFWLTLCYRNMRQEPSALQLAACRTSWWWMLTIPGGNSWWKLGKVLEPEAASRCVTKALEFVKQAHPSRKWRVSSPVLQGVIYVISTWTQVLLLTVPGDPAARPVPSCPRCHMERQPFGGLMVAPISSNHWFTGSNNLSPHLGGPVNYFFSGVQIW